MLLKQSVNEQKSPLYLFKKSLPSIYLNTGILQTWTNISLHKIKQKKLRLMFALVRTNIHNCVLG